MHCNPYSQAHCRHSDHLPQELLLTKTFRIQLPQCDPLQLSSPLISFPGLLKFWSSYTGEKVETVTDFIFLGSKITTDGGCSHEIKRWLLLGRKAIINLDSVLKSRDITSPTKVYRGKATVFPVIIYRCESWTIKKAEFWRIDTFELRCWRRLLRAPCPIRRSNKSILKEINPEYSWEGLMLKLKLQYFGHLMQKANSLENTLMPGRIEGKRRRGGRGWDGWMASPT